MAYGWLLKSLQQQLGVHPCITPIPWGTWGPQMSDLTRGAQGLPSARLLLTFSPCLLACLQKYVRESMQRCLAVGVQAGTAALVPCPQGGPRERPQQRVSGSAGLHGKSSHARVTRCYETGPNPWGFAPAVGGTVRLSFGVNLRSQPSTAVCSSNAKLISQEDFWAQAGHLRQVSGSCARRASLAFQEQGLGTQSMQNPSVRYSKHCGYASHELPEVWVMLLDLREVGCGAH